MKQVNVDTQHAVNDDLVDEYDSVRAVDDIPANEEQLHIGHHPELKTMCVVDCQKITRIVPNGEAVVLENDCFVGKVMLLVRTPDVDNKTDPHVTNMHANAARISQYFKGKKRRFEFQFQIKLKKVPTGPLFLGCELEHPVKVGAISKGLVGLLLAMVRRINPGFHYSWGPDHKTSAEQFDAGAYEKTHLSFPVEASMDRIVITKPNQEPPELGHELEESNESVKRRRKMGAGSVDWNLDDTFTMCLWSAYADWIKWKSLNVPGVQPFSFCRVTGKQPIYLSVYELPNITPQEYRKHRPGHHRKELSIYTRLEFSNEEKTEGGMAETVLGMKKIRTDLSLHSLNDTESVNSDFETASRVTMS